MGRRAIEPDTEPIMLPVTPRALHVDPFAPEYVPGVTMPRRRTARHAARPQRVGELVLTGFVLLALGGVCAVLTLVTAGRVPPVAAWAWIGGGLTSWALTSAARRSATPGVDGASAADDPMDRSSSIDVRTA